MDKTINFFSVCADLIVPYNPSSTAQDVDYEQYILPFIFFSLYSSKNAKCEIVVNRKGYVEEHQEALDTLVKVMGYRFKIREEELTQKADVSRFLLEPSIKCDYTYISDIDILITEKNIERYYAKIFKEIDIPYSNVQRKGRSLLTGTFCAETDRYYTKEMKAKMKEYLEKNLQGVRDESVLYEMMFQVHPLPSQEMSKNVDRYRPIHGIHNNLRRPPTPPSYQPDFPSWDMTNEKIERFLTISKTTEYKSMYPYFTDSYKNILNKIRL